MDGKNFGGKIRSIRVMLKNAIFQSKYIFFLKLFLHTMSICVLFIYLFIEKREKRMLDHVPSLKKKEKKK
jgi:hypothetical protein